MVDKGANDATAEDLSDGLAATGGSEDAHAATGGSEDAHAAPGVNDDHQTTGLNHRSATKQTSKNAFEDYRDRCIAAAKLELSEAPWEYLDGVLIVEDDFSVHLERRLGLRPEQIDLDPTSRTPLASTVGIRNDLQLIPCPFRPGNGGQVSRVDVHSFGDVRTALPVDLHSIETLSGASEKDMETIQEFLCIPFQEQEWRAAPTVSIRSDDPGEPKDANFSLIAAKPASKIRANLNSDPLPMRLTMQLPEYAHVDVIALELKAELLLTPSLVEETLGGLNKEEANPSNPDKKHEILSGLARSAVHEQNDLATQAKTFFFDAYGHVQARLKERSEYVDLAQDERNLTSWAGRLLEASNAFKDFAASARGRESPAEARNRAKELKTLFRDYQSVNFVLLTGLEQGELIDLSQFKGIQSVGDGRFGLVRVTAPYTAEKEPGSLNVTSTAFVAALGFLLILMACVDLSWLAWVLKLSPFTQERWSQGVRLFGRTELDINQVRATMVAVLLVVPVVLYAQFFQNRPKSVAGVKAQITAFVILSLFFIFPVLPAAWLAIGGPLPITAIGLLLLGSFAIFIAVRTAIALRQPRLLKWRIALIKGIKPSPKVATETEA